MLEFLMAPQNTPFAVVLGLLLALFLIEVIGLLFGIDIAGAAGGDAAGPGLDIDPLSGVEGIEPGLFTSFLYWINVRRIPFIILAVLFMTAFVAVGYVSQLAARSLLGLFLPWWLATMLAVAIALPLTRVLGKGLSRIMPRDETEAVSRVELVGSRAVIVLGSAARGSPAQAKVKDRFGSTHYVMVEPDEADETLDTGEPLLLVRNDGNNFFAIKHPEA